MLVLLVYIYKCEDSLCPFILYSELEFGDLASFIKTPIAIHHSISYQWQLIILSQYYYNWHSCPINLAIMTVIYCVKNKSDSYLTTYSLEQFFYWLFKPTQISFFFTRSFMSLAFCLSSLIQLETLDSLLVPLY